MTNEDYKKIEDLKKNIKMHELKIERLNNILYENYTQVIMQGDIDFQDTAVREEYIIDDTESREVIREIINKTESELDRLNKIFAEIKITV